MAQWMIIVNPHAGSGRGSRRWKIIEQCLKSQHIDFKCFFTTHKGHAIELTRDLAGKGHRHFVAVGGDGILNEVVNGLCHAEQTPLNEFILGCIPVGSGCDWVKTHQIPFKIDKAVALLKNPVLFQHDVGKVEYGDGKIRFFINVAGMAFDAFVVQQTDKDASKGFWGGLFYLYGLLISLGKYPSPLFSYKIDGIEYRDAFFCLNIGICKYSGGGMQLVPLSDPGDRLFDVTAIQKFSPLEVIWNLPYLFNGKIYKHRKIAFSRTNYVEVSPIGAAIPLEVDGEFLGAIPARFSIAEGQINVVVQ